MSLPITLDEAMAQIRRQARDDAGTAVVLAERHAAGFLARELDLPPATYAVSPDGKRLFAGWRGEQRILVTGPRTVQGDGSIRVVEAQAALEAVEPVETDFGLPGAEEGTLTSLFSSYAAPAIHIPASEQPRALEHYRLIREAFQLAVILGILDAFLDQALAFLRARAKPWYGAGIAHATDDPHVLRSLGVLIARKNALDALAAGGLQDLNESLLSDPAGAGAPQIDIARNYGQRLAREVISEGIGLLGASSASGRHGFDRYWRSAAAHAMRYRPTRSCAALGEDFINTKGNAP